MRILSLGLMALLWASFADAAAPDPHQRPFPQQSVGFQEEYAKLIRAAESVPPQAASLFGESVNLYSGATEFAQTDVDILGNDALPVAMGRRFVVEPRGGAATQYRYAFGDWDLQLPHISGVFIAGQGWLVDLNGNSAGGESNLRCSGPTAVTQARPPIYPGSGAIFDLQPQDYWQGYSLYVPGSGSQELLFRGSGSRTDTAPTDGRPYPWATKERWYFACIPLKNGAGEGFMARSPAGVTYYFDQMVVLPHPGVAQGYTDSNGQPAEHLVERSLVRLYPSRVVDRFRVGSLQQPNAVTYHWDENNRLAWISASDGRLITLTYENGLVRTVSDQSRQWIYHYQIEGLTRRLASVQLPDDSRWQFDLSRVTWGETYYWDSYDGPPCDQMQQLNAGGNQRNGIITHPSGAQGRFEFDIHRHGRTSDELLCSSEDPRERYPMQFDVLGLKSKHIIGTGVDETWGYAYSAPTGCLLGSVCPDRKTATVTAPDGASTVNTYGIRYEVNEGQLLEVAEYSGVPGGTPLRRREFHYVTNAEMSGQPFPNTVALSPQPRVDVFYSARLRPLKQRVTYQDGAVFQWSALSFDYLARPVNTSRGSSTLATFNRERTAYHDDLDDWLLGQVASVHHVFNDNSTLLMRQNTYNAGTSTLQSEAHWGKVRKRYTWHAEGTLASVTDGDTGAATTSFSDYYRGIPRRVDYAGGSFETATVGNYGQLESVTDERSATTRLYYWPSGRLQRIAYPQADSVAWNDTHFSLQAVGNGVPHLINGPHWQLTVTTGPEVKTTYLDALWRPVTTQLSDSADATRSSYVARRFDHENREIATSVAVATPAELTAPGLAYTRNSFDAIGRPLLNQVDTELSGADAVAETRYTYLPGFQRKVRNPRGQETTTQFMAWDEPTYDYPTASSLPEGVNLSIQRDAWGLPQNVLRQGSIGGSAYTVTRHYAYDEHKRLCLSSENESGTTVIDYDTAGRIAWTASGLPLNLTTTGCLRETVNASAKSLREYTARDWLRRTTFPNAPGGAPTPDVASEYFDDGALREQRSNGSVWRYDYNKRGLLEKETLYVDDKVFVLGWGYNANGDVQSLAYPNGTVVDYLPDAFGRPTRSGSYASNVRYHPNGGLRSFQYGNGSTHELMQNRRGLPLQSTDRSAATTSVVALGYLYDVNGNVEDILDLRGGSDSRSMAYDALDRLTAASGVWTEATYSYDPFDNLRSAKVGVRDYRHVYDMGVNRVTRITDQNGSTLFNLGYDARGNLTSKGAQTFVFDAANRLVRAGAAVGSNAENYVYDGHGRRVSRYKDGETVKRYSVYSKAGKLLHELDRQGNPTNYFYLGDRLLAREGIAVGEEPPATISVTPNPCGDSCVISWSDVIGATRYVLERLDTEGGSWQELARPNVPALSTTHTLTDPQGGTYQFRVAACFAPAPAPCSAWRTSSSTGITPRRVTASAPSGIQGGSFSLGWNSAKSAKYTVQRNAGTGWQQTATSIAGTSFAVTETASGNYQYRLTAYNSHGDRGASQPVSVQVQIAVPVTPPARPATISVTPAISYDGLHTVSWSAATGTGPISYRLERTADNGSSWQLAADQAGLSWTPGSPLGAGFYTYRVSACNSAGCSATLTSLQVQVATLAGPGVVSGAPNPSTTGYYAISWSRVDTADNYKLDERIGSGGTWTQIATTNEPNRSWNAENRPSGQYYYRVWACAGSTCGSAPSATYLLVVDRARPAIPATPTISPAWQLRPGGANVTVRWFGVAGAINYKLRRVAEVDECHAGDFEVTVTQQPDNQNRIVHAGGVVSANCSNPDGSAHNANPAVYGFSVAACNAAGCSDYSLPGQAIVSSASLFDAVQAAQLTYYHTDALGSPVAEIDGEQNVTRFSYEPYGARVDGSFTDQPGYTGHVGDSHSRLIYMQQRYYDPMIGRFLSPDPVTVNRVNGSNFNRYGYANNNPYLYYDPDGRCFGSHIKNNDGTCRATGTDSTITSTALIAQRFDISRVRYVNGVSPSNAQSLGETVVKDANRIGSIATFSGASRLIRAFNKIKDLVVDGQDFDQIVKGALAFTYRGEDINFSLKYFQLNTYERTARFVHEALHHDDIFHAQGTWEKIETNCSGWLCPFERALESKAREFMGKNWKPEYFQEDAFQ
jgi:RHS repeat-associated protein